MSAKPLHLGHYKLIELAAEQCDSVNVFVSTSDRKRPGEIPILGTTMHRIWLEEIEPTLPSNVNIVYGGSPVQKVYQILGDANIDNSNDDEFIVYSDPVDTEANFPVNKREKYFSRLWSENRVKFETVDRSLTAGISGTKMRQFLAAGDKEAFKRGLPRMINAERVWQLLRSDINEGRNVLRSFITSIISMPRVHRS